MRNICGFVQLLLFLMYFLKLECTWGGAVSGGCRAASVRRGWGRPVPHTAGSRQIQWSHHRAWLSPAAREVVPLGTAIWERAENRREILEGMLSSEEQLFPAARESSILEQRGKCEEREAAERSFDGLTAAPFPRVVWGMDGERGGRQVTWEWS